MCKVQVTLKGELYNIYTDTQGEQQTRLLGNVSDLRSVRVKEIGGIPIEQLQAQYEIQRDRAGKMDFGMPDIIVGFPDDTPVPLPPDTVRVYEVCGLPPQDRWQTLRVAQYCEYSALLRNCSYGPGRLCEPTNVCQGQFQLFLQRNAL